MLGQTNEQIMREFGPMGPGRKGWAMTQTVVRTAMSEASAEAHNAFWEANEELLPAVEDGYRWEWNALNDTRLCSLCAPLHGMKYKQRKDAPRRYPDRPHWGCRCDVLPITATEEQMRKDGDLPDGSFLERKEVTYTNGKRDPAPAGWRPVKEGGTAYSRPKKQDGKMYWVRRVDMPKGKTTPGDMLKRANRSSREAVLGSKKMANKWDEMIKQPRYANDPQELVRKLLGNDDMGGGPRRPPRPPKPFGGAPKPRGGGPSSSSPKPRAPKPTPATGGQTAQVLRPGNKNELVFAKQGGTAKMFEDSFQQLESVNGEVGKHARQMRQFMQKQDIVMHPAIPEKFANGNRFAGNQALIKSQRHAVTALEQQGNDAGALNGARSLLKALEDGNFDELKHVMGKASGAAGYTTRSSGIVNAAMTPSSTILTKKRVQDLIKSAEDSLKRQNAYIDFYKPGGGYGPGKIAPKGPWTADGLGDTGTLSPDSWLATSIHEVGHQLHFRGLAGTKLANKYKGLKGETFVSNYARSNHREQFAEAFVHYVLNPKGLKDGYPRLYKWVEDALEEALK